MTTIDAPNGYVVYRGPSRLDGSPIVVVATGIERDSANDKTGAMVQTWILRGDLHPVVAVNTGADAGICGQCPLRPMLARAARKATGKSTPQCYVNKGFGPAAVYRGLADGIYPDATPRQVRRLADARGRSIRKGAYGDPGAAPLALWRALHNRGTTGYSHQWRRFPGLRRLTMASADSLRDAREAWAKGWRTFRVIQSADELQTNEILCPASAEMGKRTTCEKCGLCDGSRGADDRRKSIAIIDHGPTAKRTRKTKP